MMNCTDEELSATPAITREEEARLYKFLSAQTEGDAFRYEIIAKKIQRAADGYASPADLVIVKDWLYAMVSLEKAAHARSTFRTEPQEAPFAAVKRGQVSASNYQAFLDTLEQHELDVIENNVPYFLFFSDVQIEAKKLGVEFTPAFIRSWADARLSQRVKTLRGL